MEFSDLHFIGVVVIGAILVAIIMAFIFSAKFRKDVIASEGEAAVLGLINVKGVMIVLLTAIFGGIFVYIIQLDSKNSVAVEQEPTVDSAIAVLSSLPSNNFSLDNQFDSTFIKINGQTIGAVAPEKSKLSIKKRDLGSYKWDVMGPKQIKIGYFDLNPIYVYKDYYSGKSVDDENEDEQEDRYEVGVAFKEVNSFVNSTLVFRIDSVDIKGVSKYKISFGERKGPIEAGEIDWKAANLMFKKTNAASLNNLSQFKCLTDPSWNKIYFVGLGLGNPGHHNGLVDHVDLAQIVVIELPFS